MKSTLNAIAVTVCALMIGWAGVVNVEAAYQVQRLRIKLECLYHPGATVITTASGAKLCISGEGAVWL